MKHIHAVFVWGLPLVGLLFGQPLVAESLHQQIDRLIEAGAGDVSMADQSDDSEFARRVFLDLAGRIPTNEEARAFRDNSSKEKREQLIDRLLGSADYPRRMHEYFNAMLLERRGTHDEWTKFLRSAFENNMRWDEMARAIIKPNADDENYRGAAYFVTARLVSEGAMAPVDVPGLTRDVGRLLAGVDLGCAQCHDHVSIEQYKQRDFQGLHAIYENVQTRRDVKFPAVSEKLMTQEKEFMSVFTQVKTTTTPKTPGGELIKIVTFTKGEEYAVPPDRKTRAPGEPKFSPLGELANGLASENNQLFCKNIVNRLWFMMMGKGLVEPLDLQHGDNPATHPELLDLLAREFASHDFDIKWLLREFALSKTYQRTSVVTAQAPPNKTYAVAIEKRMSAEQLYWSALLATGELKRHDKNCKPAEFEKVVAESEDLKVLKDLFVKAFANPPKEPELEFEPSVKAALFLMHDQKVLDLLAPREENLVDRLAKSPDEKQLVDELFLSVLSRPPTAEDRIDVSEYLKKHPNDRANALRQLAWALLSSTEFCVNH